MDEDLEAWEAHAELHERRDYPNLVALCEREVAGISDDLHALERLGEAYVLNGQHQKALDTMGRCHHEHPDFSGFQHILLDALFAMGKTEDDYPWKSRPEVLRIGSRVADFCYEYLRPKRKPRSVSDLYVQLVIKAYTAFTEEDLLAFLKSESRFFVEEDAPWGSVISIKRKSRRGVTPTKKPRIGL